MNTKTTRYRKPNLLVLLTCFVGIGVLATSVVQASESLHLTTSGIQPAEQAGTQQWLQSVWNHDLTVKLRTWKPEFKLDESGQALNLARPFGVRGPTLRLSNSLPDNVKRGLRAGGDHRIGASGADQPDAYMFLEKRW